MRYWLIPVLGLAIWGQAHGANSVQVGACAVPGATVSYATIQAAVNAVDDGGTVWVCPGTYAENDINVLTDKTLTLRGTTGNRADVRITSNQRAIYSSKGTWILRDMTVKSENAAAIDIRSNGPHVFENLDIQGGLFALYVDKGARLLRNLTVTNSGGLEAIYFGPNYATTFDTVTVTSPNGGGINIVNAARINQTFSFTHVSVNAKDSGIRVTYAGKVVMDNVKVTSTSRDGIRLEDGGGFDGPELGNIEISAANGMGLYAARGLMRVSDFAITAKSHGIWNGGLFSGAISRGVIESSDGMGIYFGSTEGWSMRGFQVQDVRLRAKEQGIYIARANSSAFIQRVCVKAAKDGIRADNMASSLVIRDSRFENFSNYGVDVRNSSPATVTNNAFLKSRPPRAFSNSTSHNFNGNYWQGVPGGTTYSENNVTDHHTLGDDTTVPGCYGEGGAQPPATLIAYYRMEDAAWNGTPGEWTDSVGGYNGKSGGSVAVSSPPENTTPALVGNPGTCAYARIQGGEDYTPAFTSGSLPVSTAPGAATSVSFWLRWDSFPDVSFIRWDKYALYSRNGRFGFTTSNWSQDIYGAPAPPQGTWVHVAAVFVNNNVLASELYLNGVKQALSLGTGQVLYNGDAVVQPTLYVARKAYNDFYRFKGLIDEVKVFNGRLTQAQVDGLYRERHICPGSGGAVQAANFTCVEPGQSSSGRLYTKLAGTSFSLDVLAVKADGTVESQFAADGDKTVTVELVDGSGSTACAARASLSPPVSQAVTFQAANAGRKAVSLTVARAYPDLRCRASYTPPGGTPVVGCSTDDFAVRPEGFNVTASANADPSGSNPAALPTVGAGDSFSLTATAGPGYHGTPSIQAGKVQAHAGAVQPGTLSGGFGAADPATGAASGSHFTYDEVGYFRLDAGGVLDTTFTAVDAAQGDCTPDASNTLIGGKYGCHIANQGPTAYFGRFIPHHFAITPGTLHQGCGTFTYFGQDFGTDFTLSARNAGNATTRNYTGAFARLSLNDWSRLRFAAAGTTLSQGSTAPSGSWNQGVAQVQATHRAARGHGNPPLSPASLEVTAQPQDDDGVSMSPAAVAQAAPHRFGRLRLGNAYGSELLPLPVPLTAQFWNGQGFVTNTLDHCTILAAPTLTFFPQTPSNQLANGETHASLTSPLVAGNADLRLSAPGPGNHGYVDLTVAAPEWLRYNWDGVDQGGDGNLLDDNPRARAAFGLRNTSKVIIRREIY